MAGGSVPDSNQARLADALLLLDAVVRRLRRECPWDREQDAGDIVSHTLEETYELIDAVHAGSGAEVTGELGDLLFHVFFLSLIAEERGWGDLVRVAAGVTEKLVRRHPHVFGQAEANTAAEVVERWEQIKREREGREGIFHDTPGSLPAALFARRTQSRAAAVGFDWDRPEPVFAKIGEEIAELRAALAVEAPPEGAGGGRGPGTEAYHEVGDLLFAAVNLARKLQVDPELALRSAADRFRGRVERAEALARENGDDFAGLPLERQEEYYQRAKSGL
ncbi:MAG: nucleoside triphosphate pyrophosphohydrolase [Actinobacteria bacterium]|nr:nucleoside triphosphate pyrophosphohydrolase [Actinomycetota bacterium]